MVCLKYFVCFLMWFVSTHCTLAMGKWNKLGVSISKHSNEIIKEVIWTSVNIPSHYFQITCCLNIRKMNIAIRIWSTFKICKQVMTVSFVALDITQILSVDMFIWIMIVSHCFQITCCLNIQIILISEIFVATFFTMVQCNLTSPPGTPKSVKPQNVKPQQGIKNSM